MKAGKWRHAGGHLVVAAALAACSPLEQGKVAARVNGEKIFAEEVDLALQYNGVATRDPTARQRLIEKLVIEELLAQQFLRGTPGSAVVEKSVVSTARRELLARSYVESIVGRVPRPSVEQMSAYYHANPDMFAQRRIFTLRQLDISVPAARHGEVRRRVDAAESLEALTDWLGRQNIRFATADLERGSDELDADLVARLDGLRKKGEVGLVDTDAGLRVIQLLQTRPAPIDERAAWGGIEQRLWREMRVAAVEAEVRRLSALGAISIPEGAPRGAMHAFIPGDDAPLVRPFTGAPPASVKAPGG